MFSYWFLNILIRLLTISLICVSFGTEGDKSADANDKEEQMDDGNGSASDQDDSAGMSWYTGGLTRLSSDHKAMSLIQACSLWPK